MKEFPHSATAGGEGYARLVQTLEALSHDALQIVAKRPERLKEIKQMAAYVVEIRRTLFQLSNLPVLPDGRGIPPAVSRSLVERFLELEGRVKELRNDLVRSGEDPSDGL